MARNKAPAVGGAEATLKKIDYIEEEAQNMLCHLSRGPLRNSRRCPKGIAMHGI